MSFTRALSHWMVPRAHMTELSPRAGWLLVLFVATGLTGLAR
jgi:hypothetical protein